MIKPQPLTAAGWRALVNTFVDEEHLERIFGRLVGAACNGDVGAATLVLQYRVGRPRQAPLFVQEGQIDLGDDLKSVEGCADALARIASAQTAGRLSAEEAESLRKTVEQSMRLVLATDENVSNDAREVIVKVESYDRGRIDVSAN